MKIIKYLIQFIIICVFYVIFKIIGVKLSSFLSGKLFEIIGPIFRSKKIINNNIKKAFPDYNFKEFNKITHRLHKNSMFLNQQSSGLFNDHLLFYKDYIVDFQTPPPEKVS